MHLKLVVREFRGVMGHTAIDLLHVKTQQHIGGRQVLALARAYCHTNFPLQIRKLAR